MYPSIRFLKTNKNSSLNEFRPKSNENLDDIEIQAMNGVKIARDMLAIEDASEIAKSYMFRKGVFERIMRDLGGGHCQTFKNGDVIQCVKQQPQEILHLGYDIGEEGGHYSGAVKKAGTVMFFDSMCDSPYRTHFRRFMRQRYGKAVKIVQDYSTRRFQPSGGFAPTKNYLSRLLNRSKIRTDINSAFEISQYDVLSQHHFCYVESIVYLCHKVLGTPIGKSEDPEKRLRFIKSVMWCLIFKYAHPNTQQTVFKYFARNFRYYMRLRNVRYHPKGFYLPTSKRYTYQIMKINMMSPAKARTMSLRNIIYWCLMHS